MKKLHSIALCALITPALTIGAGSAMAGQYGGQDKDRDQRGAQHEQQDQRDQSAQQKRQSGAQAAADRQSQRAQHRQESRGYMQAAPEQGLKANQLIGADVMSAADESVGPVNDLILNEDGQVVAVVIGVGGFLGIGERDVAIGWGDVTRSGEHDDLELRIDQTRESLRNAPEFKSRD